MVRVRCEGLTGEFCRQRERVRYQGEWIYPTAFETAAGSKRKKWKESIKVPECGGTSLSAWMAQPRPRPKRATEAAGDATPTPQSGAVSTGNPKMLVTEIQQARPHAKRHKPNKPDVVARSQGSLGPKMKCFRCQQIHRHKGHCPSHIYKGSFVGVLFTERTGRTEYRFVAYGQVLQIRDLHKDLDELDNSHDNKAVQFRARWLVRRDGVFNFDASDDAAFYSVESILCAVQFKPVQSGCLPSMIYNSSKQILDQKLFLEPQDELGVYQRLVSESM